MARLKGDGRPLKVDFVAADAAEVEVEAPKRRR